MIMRERRDVQSADAVVAQDLERLRTKLRGVVDHEFIGKPAQDDRVHRLGKRRVRLRGGGVVSRYLGLDHRPLLDGPERFARLAVECEDKTLLRALNEDRDPLTAHREVHQDRGSPDVVVPLVAVVDLEVPPALPRRHIERENASAKEVVARPVARIGLHGGGVRDNVHKPQLGIGRGRSPRRHVAGELPGIVLPRVVAELTGPRDHMELPEKLACPRIESHDVTGHILDTGLLVAGLVPDENHDHPVDHDRGRRARHHPEFPRDPVVRIVGATTGDVVLPPAPVAEEIGEKVNDTRPGETLERHRSSPLLERPSGLRVERPEEEARRRNVDHAPAIHLSVGHSLSVGLPGRAQVPDRLGLTEGPERLPRRRIDRHHLPARRGHGVEQPVRVDRGGAEEVVDVRTEVVAAPYPSHLEILEVRSIDLVKRRRSRVPRVTPQVAPLPVLRSGKALCRERGAGPDGERQTKSESDRPDRASAREQHPGALHAFFLTERVLGQPVRSRR